MHILLCSNWCINCNCSWVIFFSVYNIFNQKNSLIKISPEKLIYNFTMKDFDPNSKSKMHRKEHFGWHLTDHLSLGSFNVAQIVNPLTLIFIAFSIFQFIKLQRSCRRQTLLNICALFIGQFGHRWNELTFSRQNI